MRCIEAAIEWGTVARAKQWRTQHSIIIGPAYTTAVSKLLDYCIEAKIYRHHDVTKSLAQNQRKHKPPPSCHTISGTVSRKIYTTTLSQKSRQFIEAWPLTLENLRVSESSNVTKFWRLHSLGSNHRALVSSAQAALIVSGLGPHGIWFVLEDPQGLVKPFIRSPTSPAHAQCLTPNIYQLPKRWKSTADV